MKAWIVVDKNAYPCGYPFARPLADAERIKRERDEPNLSPHKVVMVEFNEKED